MIKTLGHCRCSNCSGNMDFNIKLGKLKCISCGTVLSVAEYEKEVERKDEPKEKVGQIFVAGAVLNESDNQVNPFKRTYTCSSCGGKLSPESPETTKKCPFCGNRIIFTDKYKDLKIPDFIGVFLCDRDDFLNIWHKEITERRAFVPDEFAETFVIKKISPIYVPFCFFDVSVDGRIEYTAETVKLSKLIECSNVHSAYKCSASGKMRFQHIPQDATTEIDGDISQGLEPYNFSEVKAFSFAYLSGMEARIFNMDESDSFETVAERVSDSFDRYLTDAENYQYLKVAKREYDIKQERVTYALMPIWYMEVTWKKKKFTVAMNGQTGKLACEVPVSKLKYYMFLVSTGFLAYSISGVPLIALIRKFEEKSYSGGNVLLLADSVIAGLIVFVLYIAGTVRLFRSVLSSVISLICYLLISVILSVHLFSRDDIFPLLKYSALGVHLVVCLLIICFLGYFIKESNDETTMKFRYEADDYKNNENCTIDGRTVDLLWEKTNVDNKSLIDGVEPKPGFTGIPQK